MQREGSKLFVPDLPGHCVRPGQTRYFRLSVTARLRAVQAEILDQAEVDRQQGEQGGVPEPPGPPPLGPPALAPVAEGADPPARTSRSPRTSTGARKKRGPSRDGSRRKRARRTEKREKSVSPAPSKPVREERTKIKRKSDSRSQRERSATKERSQSAERESRRKDKERTASSCSERGSRKREEKVEKITPKEESESPKEEKSPAPVASATLAATPKVRGDRGGTNSSQEDDREELVRKAGHRRPRSPPGPPPNRGTWRGAIRTQRYSEPVRWGKNKGLGKYQRNEDIRNWGWESFHASKTGTPPPRR